jgi:hypothetical protein
VETWDVAAIAFILLAFSALAGRFERSVVTPAIFFTSAGCWPARRSGSSICTSAASRSSSWRRRR